MTFNKEHIIVKDQVSRLLNRTNALVMNDLEKQLKSRRITEFHCTVKTEFRIEKEYITDHKVSFFAVEDDLGSFFLGSVRAI